MVGAKTKRLGLCAAIAGVLTALLLLGAACRLEAAPEDDNSPFWQALAVLDLPAARAAAQNEDERRFVAVLDRALRRGWDGVSEELTAIADNAEDAQVRRWGGQTLLNLLRLEGRWEALGDLVERYGGKWLPESAVPEALLVFPKETLTVPKEPAVLSIVENEARLAVVPAQVAGAKGSEQLAAVLDTGSGACIIGSEAAERLGVRMLSDQTLYIAAASGERVPARPGMLSELALGAFTARNVPVSVIDSTAPQSAAAVAPFIVGWEILQHVVVEIAGSQGEVVLRRSITMEIDPVPVGSPKPGVPTNLVLLTEPAVRLHSGVVPLLFLLDTGANATDITPELVERLDLDDAVNTKRDTLRGLGGTKEGEVRMLSRLPLTIGGLELAIENLAVLPAPAKPQSFLRIDGTLGVDVGFAGRLIIDGPNRVVELRAH